MIVDLVLNNAKAYLTQGIVDCSLGIEEGKILKIARETHMPKADACTDLKGLLVLPGLIDAHVHLRDEGKAYKEDFFTGTAAAAAGGFTTVLDMPNNNPVTMSAETLKNRMKTAENRILVNVGFYSEFPDNLDEIEEIASGGAVAFKLFMGEQVGGLNLDDDNALLQAFRYVKRLKKPVAIHAEDKTLLKTAIDKLKTAHKDSVEAFLKAHSEQVEAKAITRVLNNIKQTGTSVHFCHITSQGGLEAVTDGKKSKLPVTCETTPHNLLLTDKDLKQIGALALTVPPVRGKMHMDALRTDIEEGSIDIIASDHAPHTLEEKANKSVWNVKTGIPGLETTLPLLLTEVNRGKLSISDIVRLVAENPSKIFHLSGRGSLKERNHADLTVLDMDKKFRIDASHFHSKAKYSPFDGRAVQGAPVSTFIAGQLVMEDGEIVCKAGTGMVLRGE